MADGTVVELVYAIETSSEVTWQTSTEAVANKWTLSMFSVTCHMSTCSIIIDIPFHFSSHSVHLIVMCICSDKGLVEIMNVRRNLRLFYSWTVHLFVALVQFSYTCVIPDYCGRVENSVTFSMDFWIRSSM